LVVDFNFHFALPAELPPFWAIIQLHANDIDAKYAV
jgi:hypothetical protein